MTTAALGWFIAGIFFAGFIILWFSVSYRELSQKRRNLDAIGRQVAMHRELSMQERGGENDGAAQNILSGKLIAYNEVEKIYNESLKGPMNRIPGFLMCFRPAVKGQTFKGK